MNSRLVPVLLATIAVGVLSVVGIVAWNLTGDDGSDPADRPTAAASETPAIDREAWKAALIATGEVRADVDMEAVDELARDACRMSIHEWAYHLSLEAARPAISQVNIEHVCPEKLGTFQAGQKQFAKALSKLDEWCALPPNGRTQEQKNLIDNVGCS